MLMKLCGLAALLAVCSAQKLPVSVYYEALCSDSAKFFVEQLYPVKISGIGNYFDLTLIPFGKANYTTQGSDVLFTCQHGPNECYGNKVHACAIEHIQVSSYQNKYTKESLTLEYTNCLMKISNSFQDSVFPGARCAKEYQLSNWDVIEQCVNTTESSKLLQRHGENTLSLKPALTFVPTIVINHIYTKENQDLALNDLRSAICRALPQPRPTECNAGAGAMQHVAATATVLATTALLVFIAKFF